MGYQTGAVVAWLAAFVLGAWVAVALGYDSARIIASVRVEWNTMKVSTALALMLGGLGLHLVRSRQVAAIALSVAAAVLAVVSETGLADRWTPEEFVTHGTPGRISHVASACLVLLCCSVISLARRHPRLSTVFATLAAAITTGGVIAYAYAAAGMPFSSAVLTGTNDPASTTIAAPTAVMLLLYALGVLHEAVRQLGERWTRTL